MLTGRPAIKIVSYCNNNYMQYNHHPCRWKYSPATSGIHMHCEVHCSPTYYVHKAGDYRHLIIMYSNIELAIFSIVLCHRIIIRHKYPYIVSHRLAYLGYRAGKKVKKLFSSIYLYISEYYICIAYILVKRMCKQYNHIRKVLLHRK